MIASNEETGVSGVFPVTALMSRQAVDTLWLTLARADGATARMGVTSEHPLFVTGEGWVSAGELAPGDQIRDAAFRALTILAVEADTAPRIVHNLEVSDAHTYFAGELEAWGHNNIAANKAAGDAFRDAFFQYLENQCPGRCAREVFVRTPFGARFYDVATKERNPNGVPLEAYECKLNSARRNKKQLKKDSWVKGQGGTVTEIGGSN